jgi:hypothetical protein
MQPEFSVDDAYYPSHCGKHAPLHAVAIAEGVCARCMNAYIINSATGVCGYCENGITDGQKRHKLARERRMLKVLKACDIAPHAHNKTNPTLCAAGINYRMDFGYTFPKIVIVLEDDEDQHANRIIAFNGDEITPLLDISEDVEYMVTIAITDPDCTTEVKKSKPHMSEDGAGTSASATEISQELATTSAAVPQSEVVRRKGYSRVKELARMIIIQQIFNLPVIFVRYNPDEYTDYEGIRCPASVGDDRDRIAATFVKGLIRKYSENTQALHGLYVSYLYYNGQKPGVADSFSIDTDARKITRWMP